MAASEHAYGYDDEMQFPSIEGGWASAPVWLGSFKAPSGSGAEFSWCVEIEEKYNGNFDGTEDVTGGKARQANYIIQKYQGDKSDLTHAAISYAVHELIDMDKVNIWNGVIKDQARESVKSLAAGYLSEAAKFVGPYTLGSVDLSMNEMKGKVTKTGLTSGSGAKVTDFKATATLSGDAGATFDSNGSKSVTFTPGDELSFTATAGGPVRVDVSVEVPGSKVVKYLSDGQDIAITGGTNTIKGNAADSADFPAWQPQATSTAVKKVEVGEELIDVLHVKAAPGDSWGRIADGSRMKVVYNVDVYGPFNDAPKEQSSIPSGLKPLNSVKVSADGPGDVTAKLGKAAKPGYYTYVASVDKADQGANAKYIKANWSAPYGEASETAVTPWQPQITTETSHTVANPGTKIFDKLTVTNNKPGLELPVKSTLYGPFKDKPKLSDTVPTGAPKVATVETTVKGNGTFNTPPVELTEGGYYTWVEEVSSTHETKSWKSKFGISEETTKVKWTPQIATETSDFVAKKGESITDKLIVSGNRDGVKLPVESTLYGPFKDKPKLSDAVPANAPKVATVTTEVTGNGTFNTPSVKLPAEGYYTWVEQIKETDDTVPWKAKFGQTKETSLVKWQPQIETKTSAALAKKGEILTDTLKVSANKDGVELPVKSTLYGPFKDKPVLSDKIPADAPKVGTVETKITGNGTFKTPGLKLPESGYYTWVEEINETDETDPWKSKYGQKEETSLVKWSPQITTETSKTVAEKGEKIADKLTVSGNRPGTKLPVKSTLYGPFDAEPKLSDTIPADAKVVATVDTEITGNGTFTTPEVELPESGFYTWVEEIGETDETNAWKSKFGVSKETSLVKWIPQVTTHTSDLIAKKGAPITDKLEVSDNQPGKELEVVSTLYYAGEHRPELQDEVPADAKAIGSVKTKVTGNGVFETPALEVPTEGYYVWVEEIVETPTTKPWKAKYGIAEETTVVQWNIRSSSEISDRSANKGAQVFDNVWFAGFPKDHAVNIGENFKIEAPDNQPDAEGKYLLPADGEIDELDVTGATLTMYGPFKEQPKRSAEVPSNAPVHSEVYVPAVNGHVISDLFKELPKDGYYTIVTSFEGDDRVAAYSSDFGIPSETVGVSTPTPPPAVSTIASPDIELGGEVWDTAHVTGTIEKGSTIDFELYKFSDDVDESLTGVCDEKTLVWKSKSIKVDSAGIIESGKFTPTESGTYGYIETLRGPDGEIIDQGECGTPSETVLVNDKPKPPVKDAPPAPTPAPKVPTTPNPGVTIKTGNTDGPGMDKVAVAAGGLGALLAGAFGLNLLRKRNRKAEGDIQD